MNLIVVTAGTYLRLLVLPYGQTTYYGHLRESIFGMPIIELATLIAAIVGTWLFFRSRMRPVVTVAAALLFTTLLPVANLLPIGTVVGERCLYLPSVALCLLVGAAFVYFPKNGLLTFSLLCAFTVAGIAASASVAHQWRTPLSHWAKTANSHPGSPRAQAMFGTLLLQSVWKEASFRKDDPRLVEAEHSIELALLMNPRSPEGWYGRGLLAILRADCAAASRALRHTLELRPGDVEIDRLLQQCR